MWNAVDKHQRSGMTSVIHGKYKHEEAIATASMCETYLIIKDMKEAQADAAIRSRNLDPKPNRNPDRNCALSTKRMKAQSHRQH